MYSTLMFENIMTECMTPHVAVRVYERARAARRLGGACIHYGRVVQM